MRMNRRTFVEHVGAPLLPRARWCYGKHSHLGTNEMLALMQDAPARNMNLLMNTGPLPDGSIHPADVATLREVKHKWPLN